MLEDKTEKIINEVNVAFEKLPGIIRPRAHRCFIDDFTLKFYIFYERMYMEVLGTVKNNRLGELSIPDRQMINTNLFLQTYYLIKNDYVSRDYENDILMMNEDFTKVYLMNTSGFVSVNEFIKIKSIERETRFDNKIEPYVALAKTVLPSYSETQIISIPGFGPLARKNNSNFKTMHIPTEDMESIFAEQEDDESDSETSFENIETPNDSPTETMSKEQFLNGILIDLSYMLIATSIINLKKNRKILINLRENSPCDYIQELGHYLFGINYLIYPRLSLKECNNFAEAMVKHVLNYKSQKQYKFLTFKITFNMNGLLEAIKAEDELLLETNCSQRSTEYGSQLSER
jgi:hypothetical protein